MNITISIYDLISWLLTVISLMLFLFERKKNNRLPYYMAIQGILRACKTKAGQYGTYANSLKKRNDKNNKTVSLDEHILLADNMTSDFMSLMEHIMGSLKSIEPERDLPFDTMAFTQRKKSEEENVSNQN